MKKTYRHKKIQKDGHKNPLSLQETPKVLQGDEKVIENHFAHLKELLLAEEKAEKKRFVQEVTSVSADQREQRGKALLFLQLKEVHYNPSGQRLVTFTYRSGKMLPRQSLSNGNVVRLTGRKPHDEQPTGVVYDKNRTTVTVAFHHLPVWVFKEDTFHLNVAENQVAYVRMFDAIDKVKRARHDQVAKVRDIALGLKAPGYGEPVSAEDISFFNKNLNEKQKKAIAMSLEAEDVMLIHGPPGTGKTSVLVELIRQIKARGETCLVSSPSNSVCDHLVESIANCGLPVTRMGHPARVNEQVKGHVFSWKLAKHSLAKTMSENESRIDHLFRKRERKKDRREMKPDEKKEMFEEIDALKLENKEIRAQVFNEVWNGSDIVVATHSGSGDPLLASKTFDWIILDEATQGIEPVTWLPILHEGKLVMAGDHEQLSPVVLSEGEGPKSLSYSLFERFHDILPETSKIRLDIQYRMHEDIMSFSSKAFYEDELIASESNKGHLLKDFDDIQSLELTEKACVFIDTAGMGYEEQVAKPSGSRFNRREAELVIGQIKGLLGAGVSLKDIAVISPYKAQIKFLLDMIERENIFPLSELEIDSVDAFQGREKEAVIVSLVRSNLQGDMGFLNDLRRMNVALTRAKRKLIVIGDSATLASIPFYSDFMDYMESIQSYQSAWELIE